MSRQAVLGGTHGKIAHVDLTAGAVRGGGAEGRQLREENARLDALIDMFRRAGLGNVAAREITVSLEYPDFEELWTSLTPGYTATTKLLRGLAASER